MNSDSDDSGTTKPSFNKKKMNATDVVETALSAREDVAQLIGSHVGDTYEQVAQADEVSQALAIAVDETVLSAREDVAQLIGLS